ncbi:unnamed protein product [Ranitomeya imitator]|uniref:DEP domain-containing protein n=1 Tax=Ranitomeya imitator TaxID=111125 RepID=A0ABN9MJ05_9NEOB|nr:unnamed protein product [Ranitomeya imitator]
MEDSDQQLQPPPPPQQRHRQHQKPDAQGKRTSASNRSSRSSSHSTPCSSSAVNLRPATDHTPQDPTPPPEPVPVAASDCSSEKDQAGQIQTHLDSPLLAQESLVFMAEDVINHRSLGASGSSGPPVSGTGVPPSIRKSPSDSVAFERSLLRERGFSDKLVSTLMKSRKPVTTKIYGKTWKKFLSSSGVKLQDGVPVSEILEFLQKGLDLGLSVSTLKVQIAALGALYCENIAANPWVIRFIRAAARSKPLTISEPIRPIDPAAWVSHTAAMTGTYPAYGMSPSMSTITSTSSSITSSIPETERFDDFQLSIHSDMVTIVKAMSSPESGLEVRDRMWLKKLPSPMLSSVSSDVVDWLYNHVEGFTDRREARKYASNLLKAGYIRHTVNKITFSEQCYYIFGDLCGNMANLSLNDHDGSSGTSDQDTLAPLPHPGAAPWPMAFQYQYPLPHPYSPHPGFPEPGYSYGGGSAGSQHSEGSRSSGSNRSSTEKRKDPKTGDSKSGGSGSESDHTTRSSLRRDRAASERSVPASEHSHRSHHSIAHSIRSHHTHQSYGPPGIPPLYGPPMMMMPAPPQILGPPGAPPGRDLASIPPELTASRQSFRMAMGNPSEFFVDVM